MITEDYVSFETAKLLKEKGFDEKCQKVYMHNDQLLWAQIFMEGESFVNNECIDLVAKYNNWAGSDYAFLCPTLQMAMKWFRRVHHIHIRLINSTDESYRYEIYPRKGKYVSYCFSDKSYYETYEQACEVALKYCLENLI